MMMIGELGDDLLAEILIRLPNPRSACRRKAVCKRWRSLISSPCFSRRFISHHQRINKPPPANLLFPDDRESALLTFLRVPLVKRGLSSQFLAVFDCFKDLLLCGFGEADDRHSNAELAETYVVCNPFMKQWIALPLAPEMPKVRKKLCARLVCEPLVSNSLDLGGGYEYRFRVVCIYQDRNAIKLDVFCSESGKWTEDAFVLKGRCKHSENDVVSCNGVLYVSYVRIQVTPDELYEPLIALINPFHFDILPTLIDVSPIFGKQYWDISVSQGALHLIVFEEGTKPSSLRIILSVWRLNQTKDSSSWRKIYEGSVKKNGNDPLQSLLFPTLHPEEPETVLFVQLGITIRSSRLSCNLRSGGELEFVATLIQFGTNWRVFQPMVSCWPTPIPKYQKLRIMHDERARNQ